jgi:outer membrane lipoprotein-sorting protein
MKRNLHFHAGIRLQGIVTTCLILGAAHTLLAQTAPAEHFVSRIIAHYRQIESVSCDVRRDVSTPEGSMRWLSRVYFAQSNKLHAANAAPLPRLIISDGTTMFQHASGQARGFKRPVADLEPVMQINLARVPGTLMEHLLRLQHAPETLLEPTASAPIRRSYATEQVIAIIEADDQYRLLTMQFHDARDTQRLTAEIVCEEFEEVIPGVWISMLHQSTVHVGEHTVRERIRLSNYQANQALPEDIFNAGKHYSSAIEWVDSFDDL